MKFAHKMICLLVLVLSASFGLGECWLLYSDFAVQRRTVLTADAALHSQICTDVQTDLLDRQRRGPCTSSLPPCGRGRSWSAATSR